MRIVDIDLSNLISEYDCGNCGEANATQLSIDIADLPSANFYVVVFQNRLSETYCSERFYQDDITAGLIKIKLWQDLTKTSSERAVVEAYNEDENGDLEMLSKSSVINLCFDGSISSDDAFETDTEMHGLYKELYELEQSLNNSINNAENVANEILAAKENGEFNGKDGFSPTIEVMSVVDVVNDKPVETGVNLNITDINGTQKVAIPYGKDYVLTDTDKQEIAEMVDVKAGGESWRKLFELTTAQATAMVEQTTDDNGDVFKLKKAIIKIDFPAVSRCCAECTIDLHPADEENEIYYSLYMDNNAMANQEPYTNIASVNTKPFVNSELVEYKGASRSIDDNTSNGAFSIATRILRPIPYLDYVDYFALYDLGGKNIPRGTKITMWGVDDD